MVQCVFSPSCTLDVLVEFGEYSLEVCLIEVPSYNVYAIRVSSLLFRHHELELAECHADVSAGRNVNSSHNGCR